MIIRWVAILWLIARTANAQEMTPSESHFSELLQNYKSLHHRMDSLNAVLNDKTSRIDNLKNAPGSERTKIEALMADGLLTSQEIQTVRNQINRVELTIDEEYKALDKAWDSQIASFSAQLKQSKTFIEKERIERSVATIREKRLFLSPSVRTLSFDPSRIYKLDPLHMQDPLEAQLAADYLTQALTEVRSRQEEIRRNKSQCHAILSWQEKLSTFAEEADEQHISPFFVNPQRSPSRVESSGMSGDYQNNVGTTVKLLSQLNPAQSNRFPIDGSRATTGLDAYYQILTEVDNELDKLAKAITKKIP